MKYIRETSDIHLDHDAARWHQTRIYDPGEVRPTCDMDLLWYPEPMEGDDETCMIIAGDLWVQRRFAKKKHPHTGKSWLAMLAEQFKYVIIVLGNHDYWGANIHYEVGRTKQAIHNQGLKDKVFLLENDEIVLDGVKFVGGSLWTSFNNGDPLIMVSAPYKMNDYRFIRSGPDYKKVHPAELLKKHIETKDFIFSRAKRDVPEQKVVVVTHMAPSIESLTDDRKKYHQDYNHYYYTELFWDIIKNGAIDLWFHGHTHDPADYMIGDTRVICNPRGYAGYEDTGYDPKLRIEL